MSEARAGERCAGLTVVLPAYNEEENIENAVRAAIEAVAPLADAYEILVVDDGSVDETPAIADRLAREDPEHVRVIHHSPNKGYGMALRTGFGAATMPYVFYTDSDLQFDLKEIRYFLPKLRDNDLVIGFRVYRYDSVLRCILSWIYNKLIFCLFWINVRDVDCAFKGWRREIFQEIIKLESTDFFIDAEMVARAMKAKLRIAQLGVRHYPRKAGHTTVRPSNIPQTLLTIARLWWRIQFGKRPAAAWNTVSTESTPK